MILALSRTFQRSLKLSSSCNGIIRQLQTNSFVNRSPILVPLPPSLSHKTNKILPSTNLGHSLVDKCEPAPRTYISIELPTELMIPDMGEPPSPSSTVHRKEAATNDLKNRRAKMRKHRKKKWIRTHKSLILQRAQLKARKQERFFQEKVALWRSRSDGFDPSQKFETRLQLARRNGYYVNILKTKGGLYYEGKQ